MARFVRKQKNEIGLSPEELLFRGIRKTDKVLLRIIDFDADNLQEKEIKTIKEALDYKDSDTVTWFNIDGVHNADIMREIATGFGLEKIILSDVMDTQSRPKITEYNNCIFLSVKMLKEEEKKETVTVENLSLIVTPSVLISFQEKKGDVFEPVRDRIRRQTKRIRNSGTDYLTYALLDVVVDNYIYIIGRLGEKIEDLDNRVAQVSEKQLLDEINTYKRELNFLRKNIKPAKEVMLGLSKSDSDLVKESTAVFLKELVDNINQANESSDSYREILSDQLTIYHTNISSRLNDIMKFLTIFSVIFIPLTFIAGVYGTNFEYIPELHFKYSYFIMLGIMLIIAVSMLLYFKRKKWF
ncbi:MAG: magnesium/cobalt transporter CorA [Bacteroidales bacterium]|nr:magnesium/cobalt transporter CorA [Bacteroidales bacterium]